MVIVLAGEFPVEQGRRAVSSLMEIMIVVLTQM